MKRRSCGWSEEFLLGVLVGSTSYSALTLGGERGLGKPTWTEEPGSDWPVAPSDPGQTHSREPSGDRLAILDCHTNDERRTRLLPARLDDAPRSSSTSSVRASIRPRAPRSWNYAEPAEAFGVGALQLTRS